MAQDVSVIRMFSIGDDTLLISIKFSLGNLSVNCYFCYKILYTRQYALIVVT